MELISQFKNYLFSQKNKVSDITAKTYISDVSRFISWFEQTYSIKFTASQITPEAIQSYVGSILESNKQNSQAKIPLSARSANRYLSSLRKFFGFLETQGYTNNPFVNINIDPKQLKLASWKIQEFKNYLYQEKSADLTIKNYINDVLHFLEWLGLSSNSCSESPDIVLSKINQETIAIVS